MSDDFLRGHLDLLLLAVLAEEPRHGYAAIEALAARTGGRLDVPEGSIYPALHRLEAAGHVRSRWSTVAGRRRRVYELTHEGRRALEAGAEDWRGFAGAVASVLGVTP
jgi:PadR family transcriptional regulator PadR